MLEARAVNPTTSPLDARTRPAKTPFRVRLTGGPVNPDQGQNFETILVHQYAFVDDRIVVCSAHDEGFWRLPRGSSDAGVAGTTEIPTAQFVAHPNARFTSIAR